jgi:hypothetical protein
VEVSSGYNEMLENLGFFFECEFAGRRGGSEMFRSFSGGGKDLGSLSLKEVAVSRAGDDAITSEMCRQSLGVSSLLRSLGI